MARRIGAIVLRRRSLVIGFQMRPHLLNRLNLVRCPHFLCQDSQFKGLIYPSIPEKSAAATGASKLPLHGMCSTALMSKKGFPLLTPASDRCLELVNE